MTSSIYFTLTCAVDSISLKTSIAGTFKASIGVIAGGIFMAVVQLMYALIKIYIDVCMHTKLTTMYNIINGTVHFPTAYFVQNYFPYSSSHGTLNYIRPFAHTNYLYSSFVPSVISLWNNLPDSVKTSSISVFKAHIPH